LLAAFAGGTHSVTAAEVKRAVRDSEFYRAKSGVQKLRIGAIALVVGLVLGWATHMLLSLGAAPPRAQASPAAAPVANSRPDANAAPVASPVAVLPAASSTPSPGSSTLNNPEPVRLAARSAATPAPAGSAVAATVPEAPSPSGVGVKPAPEAAGDAPERKPVAPTQGELATARFEATQAWLRNTPGDWYAIQLATVNAAKLPQLEDFLRKASAALPAGELLVYSVKIDGQQHYRVAYGSYPSAAKALEAMKSLPQLLAAYQPYTRSVERMRSQNRQ
jgi:septal ring-binding cell division protein DamX